jgi:plastocyanin
MKNAKRAFLLGALLVAVFSVPAHMWAGDIKGKVTVQGLRSAENIAVYVDAIPGKNFDAPAQHVVIDQRKMTFVPHVVAVLKGTTVDFLNSDPVGHNVYWPSISGNKKLAHNLGTWPKGEKKSFQFNDLGVASLLCNVHPEMSGYVVVVATPYFAVTNKDGEYEIKDVPAAWQRGAEADDIARWMSSGPARFAGLAHRKGSIAVGLDADLVIWDPEAEFTVDPSRLRQRHKLTPYAGRRLSGVVHKTILRGRNVDSGDTPTGRILRRHEL